MRSSSRRPTELRARRGREVACSSPAGLLGWQNLFLLRTHAVNEKPKISPTSAWHWRWRSAALVPVECISTHLRQPCARLACTWIRLWGNDVDRDARRCGARRRFSIRFCPRRRQFSWFDQCAIPHIDHACSCAGSVCDHHGTTTGYYPSFVSGSARGKRPHPGVLYECRGH